MIQYKQIPLFLILFLGFPFGMHLCAQDYQIEDIVNVEDGLPSNETYGSFFDKNGDLLILTDKGLARYDGVTVTVILSEMDFLQ